MMEDQPKPTAGNQWLDDLVAAQYRIRSLAQRRKAMSSDTRRAYLRAKGAERYQALKEGRPYVSWLPRNGGRVWHGTIRLPNGS